VLALAPAGVAAAERKALLSLRPAGESKEAGGCGGPQMGGGRRCRNGSRTEFVKHGGAICKTSLPFSFVLWLSL
jgi:hypothetical protein